MPASCRESPSASLVLPPLHPRDLSWSPANRSLMTTRSLLRSPTAPRSAPVPSALIRQRFLPRQEAETAPPGKGIPMKRIAMLILPVVLWASLRSGGTGPEDRRGDLDAKGGGDGASRANERGDHRGAGDLPDNAASRCSRRSRHTGKGVRQPLGWLLGGTDSPRASDGRRYVAEPEPDMEGRRGHVAEVVGRQRTVYLGG